MAILLVTGSRSIVNKRIVIYALEQVLHDLGNVKELVHGGASGVDTLAGEWAKTRNINVRVVSRKDKQTYTERDYAMVDLATHVAAIWDGESSGTRLTSEYASKCSKLLQPVWLEAHIIEELFGSAMEK